MSDEIVMIGCEDGRYPPLLRHIPDRPAHLFVRGSVEALSHSFPMAVVGTRSMSRYGAAVIGRLVGPLARAGAAIVSGLALGADAAAHEAALAADGLTVAVLAAGVDRQSLGPKANAGLAERIIAKGGALISEHPPGTHAQKHHFPLRNRIVAGMSRATLVVEAPLKSGALLTVKAALEYGRDVFTVPGPITYPSCEGTNKLLMDGAAPACTAEDILGHYGIVMSQAHGPLPAVGSRLIACLDVPRQVDELSALTGMDAGEVLAELSLLEISGNATRADEGWVHKIDSVTGGQLL